MFHGNEEKSAEVEKHAIGSEAALKERIMFHGNEEKSAEIEDTPLN